MKKVGETAVFRCHCTVCPGNMTERMRKYQLGCELLFPLLFQRSRSVFFVGQRELCIFCYQGSGIENN